MLLQNGDINNLESWSMQAVSCLTKENAKVLVITRRRQPINHPCSIKGKELAPIPAEKDLGIWIASDLIWSKHVLDRCARANKLLGFVKRCSGEISDARTPRTLYLSLVRSVFGYSSQVCSPQTVTLIQRMERVQRRATKYILNLPYLCSETYREPLARLGLLPLSYWHEYLDLVFFFKAVTSLVDACPMASSPKSCPKPERPDPPVATKSPSVQPNAKPTLPTNAPSLFVHPDPGTLYQLH
jgi:hypothetical protein